MTDYLTPVTDPWAPPTPPRSQTPTWAYGQQPPADPTGHAPELTPVTPPWDPSQGDLTPDQVRAMAQRYGAEHQSILGAASQGAAEGFGSQPLGMSDQTRQDLRQAGLYPTMLQPEIEFAANLGDLASRGYNAAVGGVAHAAGYATGSQSLERDVRAMPEAFAGMVPEATAHWNAPMPERAPPEMPNVSGTAPELTIPVPVQRPPAPSAPSAPSAAPNISGTAPDVAAAPATPAAPYANLENELARLLAQPAPPEWRPPEQQGPPAPAGPRGPQLTISANRISHPEYGPDISRDQLQVNFANAAHRAAPSIGGDEALAIGHSVARAVGDDALAWNRNYMNSRSRTPDQRAAWDAAFNHGSEYAVTPTQANIPATWMPPVESGPYAPFTTYHASPHLFTDFDISKIGTGEGNQAYGLGLYTAQREGTARSYYDTFKQRTEPTFSHPTLGDNITAPSLTGSLIGVAQSADPLVGRFEANGIASDIVRHMKEHGDPGSPGDYHFGPAGPPPSFAPAWNAALQHAAEYTVNPPKAYMYEVSQAANPDHYIDWDTPINQQHPMVQAALDYRRNIPDSMIEDYRNRGENAIADALQEHQRAARNAADYMDRPPHAVWDLNDPATVEQLRNQGIPGIKYLDQSSRLSLNAQDLVNRYGSREAALQHAQQAWNDATGPSATGHWAVIMRELQKPETRNFVNFDDKNLAILRQYGLAGLGIPAAMAAGAYSTGQPSQQAPQQPLPSMAQMLGAHL